MKTCPVCRSRCFDDMPVCYGCLHDFERGISIKNAVDKVDKDAEDMPEEAILPQSSSHAQSTSSVSQAHQEANSPRNIKDMQNAAVRPNTATIKLPSLGTVGVHSFGASDSDATNNKARSSALELPIPMLTSVEASEQNWAPQRFDASICFEGRGVCSIFDENTREAQGSMQKSSKTQTTKTQEDASQQSDCQETRSTIAQSKPSWATGQGECDARCCGGVASKGHTGFNGTSPWLSLETGEGYRLVFRFEPA